MSRTESKFTAEPFNKGTLGAALALLTIEQIKNVIDAMNVFI